MKKFLFMMMIASNLNASDRAEYGYMQVKIKPAISKVSREEERKSRVLKFAMSAHSIYDTATYMRDMRTIENSLCKKLYDGAEYMLTVIHELNGTKNRDENYKSCNFLSDTGHFLKELLEIMNKTSEPLIRRQLDEIEETYQIVMWLILIRARSHVCSTSASGAS